jgi:hypothetical protein
MRQYLFQGIRSTFAPKHTSSRIAMHGIATAAGIAGAWRFGADSRAIAFLLWYVAFFVLSHVVMVPMVAGWHMARDRIDRWVRGIVEEELMVFDLKSYRRQLFRVFPAAQRPDDEEPPAP